MSRQVTRLHKLPWTQRARIRPFPGVRAHVHVQITGPRKPTLAHLALITPIACVADTMPGQFRPRRERPTAVRTRVRFFALVCVQVCLQLLRQRKAELADVADERLLTGMDAYVRPQLSRLGELLLADATHERRYARRVHIILRRLGLRNWLRRYEFRLDQATVAGLRRLVASESDQSVGLVTTSCNYLD